MGPTKSSKRLGAVNDLVDYVNPPFIFKARDPCAMQRRWKRSASIGKGRSPELLSDSGAIRIRKFLGHTGQHFMQKGNVK